MVLLPEGKIINNPDQVKLIKVLPSELDGETLFLVVIKLGDDSEIMVDRCATQGQAEGLADTCFRMLNGEKVDLGSIPSFAADEASEESSDWDDSEDDAVSKPANATSTVDEDSSSWDFSDAEDVTPVSVKGKSATSSKTVEENSKKKPVIKEPFSETAAEKSGPAPKKSTVTAKEPKPSTNASTPPVAESAPPKEKEPPVPKEVPRIASFIEEDSDEWIQDNGLDDWFDAE